MNRLILIGNGFDLAHGLKTSYKDFIFWYLDSCFNNAGIYETTSFEDEFVYVKVLDHYRLMNLGQISREKGVCTYLNEKGILNRYLDREVNEAALRSTQQQIALYYEVVNTVAHEVNFKSHFFKHLIFICIENNWVDIEIEYYESLKACKKKDGSFDLKKVRELNKELEYFKSKLEEYLKLQEDGYKGKVNPEILKLIDAKFEIEDFDTIDEYESLQKKLGYDHTIEKMPNHHVYLLNFNYTNIANTYKDKIIGNFETVDINHIHGKLNNPKNPIIFGFGDEYDKEYLNFEEQRNNDIFKHIKSYQYFKTPNYRNLARFLRNGEYQVFVMGHSCGLSDRTMFKEIFEHENCKSVKIFHYSRQDGTNDFEEKTINLGRHFSNKGKMRKLIVEFDEANAFPQCD